MKAQAAVEYLVVIGFMTAIIVPLSYFYLHTVGTTTDNVVETVVDTVGHTLIDTASEVYYSTGYAKRTFNLNVPEGVMSITGMRMRDIAIDVQTEMGIEPHYYKGDVPISVNLDPNRLLGGSFVLEKRQNIVVICTEACQCDATEVLCGDNLDNDCDGQTDMCDTDCPGTTDADTDGWTVQCGTPDCDDSNSKINPVAYDVCGNGIDEDCDQLDASC